MVCVADSLPGFSVIPDMPLHGLKLKAMPFQTPARQKQQLLLSFCLYLGFVVHPSFLFLPQFPFLSRGLDYQTQGRNMFAATKQYLIDTAKIYIIFA